MAANKSAYLANKVIDHVLGNAAYTMPGQVYLALYTSDPTVDNTGTEVTGGSYARQALDMTRTSTDGEADNDSTINFNDLPAASIGWWGILDAATSGNLLYFGTFAGLFAAQAGDDLAIDPAKLILQER